MAQTDNDSLLVGQRASLNHNQAIEHMVLSGMLCTTDHCTLNRIL
jgi:hypothetical protein